MAVTDIYFKPIPVNAKGGEVVADDVFKTGNNSDATIGVGADGLGPVPAPTASGFNFSNGLGVAQIGLGALNAYTGFQNYKLQKEALAANIENANRNYEAEKTKYNNAVARTEAVNKHFGSENVTARI